MSHILVTGGNGFIGQSLCPELIKAGHRVTISTRIKNPVLKQNNCDYISTGDFGPQTNWEEALKNIDAIVHLAGRAHIMKETNANPLELYRHSNVEGTRQLALSALKHGIRRFIFISSIKVYGEETTSHSFCETDKTSPNDPYALSKLEAEKMLNSLALNKNFNIVILRPPLIYGPHVKGNFKSLLQACSKNIPLPVGSIKNKRSFIFIGNLNSAIIKCLSSERAVGQTFIVSDGEAVSTAKLVTNIALSLNNSPRLLNISPRFLKLIATFFCKQKLITRLTNSLVVNDSKIKSCLEWEPPYTMKEGLKITAKWFKKNY